jgi:GTP-binding protein HflX
LVDTVGFIRNLPHTLVDAFHSTLEEATLADILIHVADASDPDVDAFYATTLQVLESLGAADIPTITVLNKIDRLPGDTDETCAARFPGAIPLSAQTGQGLEELKARMEELLSGASRRFRFPADRGDLAALIHRNGQVLSEAWDDEGILIEARVDGKLAGQLGEFRV